MLASLRELKLKWQHFEIAKTLVKYIYITGLQVKLKQSNVLRLQKWWLIWPTLWQKQVLQMSLNSSFLFLHSHCSFLFVFVEKSCFHETHWLLCTIFPWRIGWTLLFCVWREIHLYTFRVVFGVISRLHHREICFLACAFQWKVVMKTIHLELRQLSRSSMLPGGWLRFLIWNADQFLISSCKTTSLPVLIAIF